MDRSANVTSIDAIRAMRAAVLQFEAGARDGLESLVLESRRALDWIEHDRRRYWPAQVREASTRLVEARNQLERCQLKYGSEEAPSCYEQKKAFERAKRRLRFCEEKVKITQRWMRTVRQEMNDFDGRVAQLSNWLDSDLPRAVEMLERMLEALDRYAGSSPPGTERATASGSAEKPAADAGELKESAESEEG